MQTSRSLVHQTEAASISERKYTGLPRETVDVNNDSGNQSTLVFGRDVFGHGNQLDGMGPEDS